MIAFYYTKEVDTEEGLKHLRLYLIEENKPKLQGEISCNLDRNSIQEINYFVTEVLEIKDTFLLEEL